VDTATIAFLVLGGLGGLTVGATVLSRRRHTKPTRSRPNLNELLRHLPPELAGRYLELFDLEKRIRQTVKAHGLEPVMAGELAKLDLLIDGFLRLANEAARFRAHLQASPPGTVEKEAASLRERLAKAEGETAILMQQNLAVVEKRLEKLEQVRNASAQIKAQLDLIEDTVRLLNDQALAASRIDDIQIDFDGVLRGVASTEAALVETRAAIGDRAHASP
jgi:hypothetical protein